MSMSSFNKFSLRINSKISLTTFCTIWLHFYWRGFVLTKHQVQRFTRSKVLKEVLFILFCFRCLCVLQVLERCLTRNIPGIVRDHVKVYISFLSLGIQSQKSSLWSTSLTMKYISQENDNFESHICISHPSRLWFLVNSWVLKPNARTKDSWTLNSLDKKLYFNFIVSIKSVHAKVSRKLSNSGSDGDSGWT